MPFVTEEIYQIFNEGSIVVSDWPTNYPINDNSNDYKIEKMLNIITSVRNMRVNNNVAPSKPLTMIIDAKEDDVKFFNEHKEYLKRFANYETLSFDNNPSKDKAQVIVLDDLNVIIPLKELIDIDKEKERLSKEQIRLSNEVKRSENMLNNPSFTSKAPQAKVDAEKEKLEKYQQQLKEVENLLKSIEEMYE